MIIITPISSVTPLLLVEMVVEDTMVEEEMGMRTKKNWRKVKVVVVVKAVEETMEEEPMRSKKIWRKTILEPDDDESEVKQMSFLGLRLKIRRH